MMNPTYHFARMRELLDEFEPSRERSLAQTKLDECQLWLTRCMPTRSAIERDQCAPAPNGPPEAAAARDEDDEADDEFMRDAASLDSDFTRDNS